MGKVHYEQFCKSGNRLDVAAREAARRLVEVVRILQDCEESRPERVARDRDEVYHVRQEPDPADGLLMQHVAHCTDGCKRAPAGAMAFASDNQAGMFSKAPTHGKPELPSASELAAMVDAGATLDDLAAKYDRHRSTIYARLRDAGYGAKKAVREATVLLPLVGRDDPRAWIRNALCAQIDPEIFFPEKGGSTREAKAICATCDVQVECLDDAIANGERFGIWGGVSERTRRKLDLTTNPSTTENTQEAS